MRNREKVKKILVNGINLFPYRKILYIIRRINILRTERRIIEQVIKYGKNT